MNVKTLLCGAAMLAVCSVAQAAMPAYTLKPTDGKSFDDKAEFATFNLTFNDSPTVVIKDDAKATLMNETTGGDDITSTQFYDFYGTILIKFDTDQITENGTWTFTIPKGQITVNGEENAAITASYSLLDSSLGGATEYDPITLVSANPADGSNLPVWGGEYFDKVTFQTSDDAAVNYIEWYLYDVTNGAKEYIRQGNDNRYDLNRYHDSEDHWANGLFVNVSGEEPLVKGHTYSFEVRFCAIGYDLATNQYPSPDQITSSTLLHTTLTYNGMTEPQEYSASEYLSISPDPTVYEISNPDLAEFTITYSGPAKPIAFDYAQGMGFSAPAGTYAPADGYQLDANGCASAWTFTFDKEVVKQATGTLITNVVSQDKDGLYVKGNGGMLFDDIYYMMNWNCNCGATPLISVSPADNAEVEELSSITISNDDNGTHLPMGISYVATDYPKICSLNGEEVRALGEPTISSDLTQATWTFNPITSSGTYVFIVPNHYFVTGEEGTNTVSNQTEFTYYVVNSSEAGNVSYTLRPTNITPEDGATLSELGTVTLAFGETTFNRADGSSPKAQLFKVTSQEEMLIEEVEVENNPASDFFAPTIYDFKFTPRTDAGTYKVIIKKGTFGTEAWDMSGGLEGTANPEIVLNYTVGTAAEGVALVSVLPADNAELEELSSVAISNEKNVAMALNTAATAKAEIMTMTGGRVCELDAPTFSAENTLATWNFDAITDEGNYILHVPAEYFTIGDTQELSSEAFFTYFVVSPSSGNVSYTIEPKTVTPADGSTVTELSTITLEFSEVVYSPYYAPTAKLYKVTAQEEMLIEEKSAVDNPASNWLNPTIYDYKFTAQTEPGTYKVVIAQGTFGTGDWDETGGEAGKANPEIVLNYTIEGAAAEGVALVSVTPADNAEVEELSSASISNEKNAAMALNTASTAKAEIMTMTGGRVCELDAPTFNADNTLATWNFDAITDEGNYILHVPAEYFTIGDAQEANTEAFFTYFVVSPSSGNVSYTIEPKSVTPADGSTVTELSTITLEFSEVVYSPYYAPMAKLYKVTAQEEMLIEEKAASDNPDSNWLNPTIYDYKFTAQTEPGTYKVVIAQGTFGTGDWDETGGEAGKANPEIVLNYTVKEDSAIDSIIAAGEPVNVYTVQGIQVLRNAEPTALKNLASGLYIVNGQKLFIRK